LGFHRYAVSTHPDKFVPEPPRKKSWIRLCPSPPSMGIRSKISGGERQFAYTFQVADDAMQTDLYKVL